MSNDPSPCATFAIHGYLRGLRLDQAISQVLPGISTRDARQMIVAGRIISGGSVVRRNHRVREGACFDMPHPPSAAHISATAPLPPLTVVYEDDALLVVDKPANVVVHPSYRNADGTLYDALLAHAASLPGGGLAFRPSLVQRLDKNTSGLLLVAKIPSARRQFQRQLDEHRIEKGYMALVHGSPGSDCGVVDAPLARDPLDRRRVVISNSGQPSTTHWRVTERIHGNTLLAITIETGRTHQIRVHMQAIGLPIVGDPVYGVPDLSAALHRQFLHASSLSFDHPLYRHRRTFASPLPPDLANALATVRVGDGTTTSPTLPGNPA